MKKMLLSLAVCLLFTVTLFPQETPQNTGNSFLGINLNGVVDWSTQFPFVDIFKSARPWIPQRQGAGWGEGGELALSPEGWVTRLEPNQFAETVLFSADTPFTGSMDGEYVILFDGEGEIAFRGNNVTVNSQSAGRLDITARPSQGSVFLQVTATNEANPLKNIRFLMASHEQTYISQPFNPLFLERFSRFGILRFMDWMQTNDEPAHTWSERPLLTDYTFALRGVPVEMMIQLANTLQTDAWFTLPHRADDEYVRQFAILVLDALSPNLKAYVEYSNETWNGQFVQANYVIETGLAQGLGSGDAFWAGLQYHSKRANEMFRIFEEVFGGNERLVRVLASQAANSWTTEQVLLYEDAFQSVDAVAIAPYFSCDDPANPDNVEATLSAGLDGLLAQQLINVQEGGCAYQYMIDQLEITRRFNVDLIAYEGGQHLSGYFGTENNDALTELFIGANRDPRMTEIYLAYLNAWRELGGGVFMAFSDVGQPSRFGSWGVLETLTQDIATAPKYLALMAFIDSLQGQ